MNISRFLEQSSASFDFKLVKGGDLLRRKDGAAPPLATHVPAIDRLSGGGLKRGALAELVGARSSGSFSIVLAVLAAATDAGEAAALIDCGDQLDPRQAEEAGVCLERLLWVRPARLNDALHAAEMIIGSGFGAVAIDMGSRSVSRAAAPDAAWMRLARAARGSRAVCLLSTPHPLAGPAAVSRLVLERSSPAWTPGAVPLFSGLRLNVSVHRRTDIQPLPPARLALGAREGVGI